MVSLKLRNAGFRVLTASDGQEALELALAENPDLLITDYHMPLLSGLELCQRLRQQNKNAAGDHADGPRLQPGAGGYDAKRNRLHDQQAVQPAAPADDGAGSPETRRMSSGVDGIRQF